MFSFAVFCINSWRFRISDQVPGDQPQVTQATSVFAQTLRGLWKPVGTLNPCNPLPDVLFPRCCLILPSTQPIPTPVTQLSIKTGLRFREATLSPPPPQASCDSISSTLFFILRLPIPKAENAYHPVFKTDLHNNFKTKEEFLKEQKCPRLLPPSPQHHGPPRSLTEGAFSIRA